VYSIAEDVWSALPMECVRRLGGVLSGPCGRELQCSSWGGMGAVSLRRRRVFWRWRSAHAAFV